MGVERPRCRTKQKVQVALNGAQKNRERIPCIQCDHRFDMTVPEMRLRVITSGVAVSDSGRPGASRGRTPRHVPAREVLRREPTRGSRCRGQASTNSSASCRQSPPVAPQSVDSNVSECSCFSSMGILSDPFFPNDSAVPHSHKIAEGRILFDGPRHKQACHIPVITVLAFSDPRQCSAFIFRKAQIQSFSPRRFAGAARGCQSTTINYLEKTPML